MKLKTDLHFVWLGLKAFRDRVPLEHLSHFKHRLWLGCPDHLWRLGLSGMKGEGNHPQGAKQSCRTIDDIDLCVSARIEIGEDVDTMIDKRRPAVAFNMGGMGSAETNFYNDAFKRAGYGEDARAIQALWLAGKRKEAAERVPASMVTEFQVLGTPKMVRQRLGIYKAAGVTTLKLGLDGAGPLGPARFELLEQIIDITKDL